MQETISVIIPVYHEHKINDLLKHVRTLKPHEVIVVDGAPEKDTLALIDARQVKKIASAKGRGNQMNAGAQVASGTILLFLHADTFLPKKGLVMIKEVFADKKIVAGAFDLRFGEKGRWYRFMAKIISIRSRISKIPYGDQAIFVRKAFFEQLGGFSDFPIMEDVDFMLKIRKQKRNIHILKTPVITSSRRFKKEGVLYAVLRNWILRILFSLGVSPHTLARWYR